MRGSVEERFSTYAEKTETCWLWTRRLSPKGYGFLWVSYERGMQFAHRVSHELFIGPIPENMQVDHLCHNQDTACAGGDDCPHRRCVNPAHLEAVPAQVNQSRGRGGRRAKCYRGHVYDETNTRWRTDPDRPPAQVCRACRRIAQADRLRRRRLADGISESAA